MTGYPHDKEGASGNISGAYRMHLIPGSTHMFVQYPEGVGIFQQADGIGYKISYDILLTDRPICISLNIPVAILYLLYVLEGQVSVGKGHLLTAGSYYLCCAGPSVSHTMTFAAGCCRILQIEVTEALRRHATDYAVVDELYKMMSQQGYDHIVYRRQGDLDYASLLLIDKMLKSDGTAWEMELLVQSTASALVKIFVGDMERASSLPSQHGVKKLEAVREYVSANLHQQLRIHTLARIYGASAATLNKQYRKQYGESLQSYIHGLKMQRALILLRDKKITVNEVAEMTGYNNANNFTRAFTSYFGYTPSVVRKATDNEGQAKNDRI